jgi:hypothetical protein
MEGQLRQTSRSGRGGGVSSKTSKQSGQKRDWWFLRTQSVQRRL